jgi:hypothetical protein
MRSYEEQKRSLEARKERSEKISHNLTTETGVMWSDGKDLFLVEYSETHLHKGHVYEHYESLSDNSVEHTVWYFCQTCKAKGDDPEFWFSSIEMA